MKQADVFRLRAVVAFGLDEDLPLPAEAVEVVHEVAAHEGLQRLADLREIDALRQDLVAIDVDEDLRHGRQERAVGRSDLRPLAHSFEEAVQVLAEEGHVAARAIFEHEGDAAGRADAGNRRRRKGEADSLRDGGELLVDAPLERGVLLLGRGSLFPWLQRDEEKRVERGVDGAEQIVADHGRDVRDAGRVEQRFLDFARRVARALHRRGIRATAASRRDSPGLPPAENRTESREPMSPADTAKTASSAMLIPPLRIARRDVFT